MRPATAAFKSSCRKYLVRCIITNAAHARQIVSPANVPLKSSVAVIKVLLSNIWPIIGFATILLRLALNLRGCIIGSRCVEKCISRAATNLGLHGAQTLNAGWIIVLCVQHGFAGGATSNYDCIMQIRADKQSWSINWKQAYQNTIFFIFVNFIWEYQTNFLKLIIFLCMKWYGIVWCMVWNGIWYNMVWYKYGINDKYSFLYLDIDITAGQLKQNMRFE